MEGAGVKLFRVFGSNEVPDFDPFLLLDHFGSDNPEDYIKGFPWHPHRGIETVTYMLEGEVEHGDSLGNKGVIRSGDIQWMTAGSGIIHQEMPKKYDGFMQGFQLWVNLPKSKKMMKPRYKGVLSSDTPAIEIDGAKIKVIAGKVNKTIGPVTDLIVDVDYFDITLEHGKKFKIQTKKEYSTFIYIITGSALIENKKIDSGSCVLFSKDSLIESANELRFLFISGKKLNEPVAWGGPIVMNTEDELRKAFEELDNGNFIKDSSIKASNDFYKY